MNNAEIQNDIHEIFKNVVESYEAAFDGAKSGIVFDEGNLSLLAGDALDLHIKVNEVLKAINHKKLH